MKERKNGKTICGRVVAWVYHKYMKIISVVLGNEKLVKKHGLFGNVSTRIEIEYNPDDGYIYFGKKKEHPFQLLSYRWAGANTTIVETIGTDVSVTKGRIKTTGRIGGAIIGGALGGGVGAAIGAVHGTGKKSKYVTTTATHSISTERERASLIEMRLRNIDTGEEFNIGVEGSTSVDKELKDEMPFLQPQLGSSESASSDVISKLKDLKELFESGVIEESEFEKIKRKLLEG